VILAIYQTIQVFVSYIFAPVPPQPDAPKSGHVAVIGAGVSGISTASQLISQGFDVTIFEKGSETGGIWANVNSTSSLQLNSIMYRFHPLVHYTEFYPFRDEILNNLRKVWKMYGLAERTRFNTEVKSVERHSSSTPLTNKNGHTRWIINGNQSEVFDAVVATIGTCGPPKRFELPGEKNFKGTIIHSSELDGVDFKDKKVLIIGGGASGLEALELAVELGANKPTIITRSDKWMIPRCAIAGIILSLLPFAMKLPFSWVPQYLLRKLHYRELASKMAPNYYFFTMTPMVNNNVLELVRAGKADYHRGDIIEIKENGINWNKRAECQDKGEKGETEFSEADVIVVATGFNRPKLDFLPKDLCPKGYSDPNFYMQVFPINDWSVLCTNSTYREAIGTVGHFHIGFFARMLVLFLNDPAVRPSPADMKRWVDTVHYIKKNTLGGPLSFITYIEYCAWVILFHLKSLQRLKYITFVLFGFGFWSYDEKTKKPVFHYCIFNLPRIFVEKISRLKMTAFTTGA